MTETPEFEPERGGEDVEHAFEYEGVTEDVEPRGENESVETPTTDGSIE
jgi:hypothetical protein